MFAFQTDHLRRECSPSAVLFLLWVFASCEDKGLLWTGFVCSAVTAFPVKAAHPAWSSWGTQPSGYSCGQELLIKAGRDEEFWFSANGSATAVWLANGFCLAAQMWPKKEARAGFAWPGMLFQPTSAQMHAYFDYLLASTFRNYHADSSPSTSTQYELDLVLLLVVFI